MAAKLADEIQQDGPFSCLEQEAFINVIRTADAMIREFDAVTKAFGISAIHYNVLRILRRHRDTGCACKTIGESLVTRDPDVTRLLDRLEDRGFITRSRYVGDRRVVTARITPAGLKLVDDLEPSLLAMHQRQLGYMGPRKLKSLILVMEKVRHVQERRLRGSRRR